MKLTLAHRAHPLDAAAIVGDIHGCADALEELLRRLPDDRALFFVGDLIDRGPDSRGVLDLLIERGAAGVCGNHELWFRQWLGRSPFGAAEIDTSILLPGFGASETLRSYGLEPTSSTLRAAPPSSFPAAHREFLLGLPHVLGLGIAGESYWLIHAGLPPAGEQPPPSIEAWMELRGMDLLWGMAPLEARPPIDRTVIMGHVPQPVPVDLGHLIALDTGAGLWPRGTLTALLLPERRFLSVPVETLR